MAKGKNKKNNSNSEKVKYYASPVILSDEQKKNLGIPVSDTSVSTSKVEKGVDGGLDSLSADELKAKKSVMLKNIFKISSFAGISTGLLTGIIVNVIWGISFLNTIVSSVISVILLVVGVMLSIAMANLIKTSISGSLSKAGAELYHKLRVDLWIRNLSALIFMIVCAACFLFKLL